LTPHQGPSPWTSQIRVWEGDAPTSTLVESPCQGIPFPDPGGIQGPFGPWWGSRGQSPLVFVEAKIIP
jgi:hypothetical protein